MTLIEISVASLQRFIIFDCFRLFDFDILLASAIFFHAKKMKNYEKRKMENLIEFCAEEK
jgi:hypothetical protein